jgi:hypothetical protein
MDKMILAIWRTDANPLEIGQEGDGRREEMPSFPSGERIETYPAGDCLPSLRYEKSPAIGI